MAYIVAPDFFQFLTEGIKCSWTATVERAQVSYNACVAKRNESHCLLDNWIRVAVVSEVIPWYMKLETAGD